MRALVRFLPLLCPLLWLHPGGARGADPASAAGAKTAFYLMMPEPRVMRSSLSRPHGGSQRTVFTPMRLDGSGRVTPWKKEDFARLGISWDTFLERAGREADRRLASLQPEWKRDAAGRVLYGVIRGDEPTVACLLVAPALGEAFKKTLGNEVWVVVPDRHSLFLFPPNQQAIEEFAADLKERFDDSAFAASDEIFAAKAGEALRVVGSFVSRS